jgi:hypothetical protein
METWNRNPFFQVARPMTMKKDGIQTRNRKLSAKSKKKRGSVVDFFSPFDAKSFSYGGMSALSAMGGGGSSGSTGYLGSSMTQYYGSGMAAQVRHSVTFIFTKGNHSTESYSQSMASQFMSSSGMMYSTGNSTSPSSLSGLQGPPPQSLSPLTGGFPYSGSNSISQTPSIIGALT